MGKNGKNIRSKKKILEALDQIDSPFTCVEMANLTGLHTSRVSNLLKQFDDVEKIPLDRSIRRIRAEYKVIR